MNKQIVCIHWGTQYGPAYVNRLYAMVARNITPPFRFVCFCDDPNGMREEIECFELPPINCDIPKTRKGIWPKSRLWNKQLADLQGPFLFMDIDLVITGNLDGFFEYGDPDDVILSHNPSNPLERLGQTSVYRAPVGKLFPLLERFERDPLAVIEEYTFEQRYVTRNAPGGIKLWPKSWVRHFRRHCRRPFPLNYMLQAKRHSDAKIVIFPGGLSPQDAINGVHYHKYGPHQPQLQYLLNGFKGKRHETLWKHLRYYILPTQWVKDLWRE